MNIETQRLIVRNYVITDKEDLTEYLLQRKDAWFEGYPWFEPQKADEEIKFRSESDEFFAIELKLEKKVIGNIYLGKREFNTRELGYVLNEKYMQKGYGAEAAAAAVKEMFKSGVHRIYAEAAPENTPSWKLMEKIGMEREAFLRKNVSFHNDKNGNPIYFDTYVYALLNPLEK